MVSYMVPGRTSCRIKMVRFSEPTISAGLDCPYVGPEHAWLKDTNRAEYVVSTDEQALHGFRILIQKEGIIPGELKWIHDSLRFFIFF